MSVSGIIQFYGFMFFFPFRSDNLRCPQWAEMTSWRCLPWASRPHVSLAGVKALAFHFKHNSISSFKPL